MKKKITILIAGLLLAVGWSNSASAQRLPAQFAKRSVTPSKSLTVGDATERSRASISELQGTQGPQFRAPLRTNNYTSTADVVHPKSWYDSQDPVTWTDLNGNAQSTLLTAPYTDANGMMALVRRVYTDPLIPGAKHSDAWGNDIPYQTIQYGWNILGTNYNDPIELTAFSGVAFYMIRVQDPLGHTLAEWWAPQSGTTLNLPEGWSVSAQMSRYTFTDYSSSYYGDDYYCYYFSDGGTITIPTSVLSNPYGYVDIQVAAISRYQTPSQNNSLLYAGNSVYGYNPVLISENDDIYIYGEGGNVTSIPGTITPPDDNGYTVMLVKLKDGINDTISVRAPRHTANEDSLRNYFKTYVKEIQMLTDGMRVGTGTDNAGTVFSYTGMLNRFFFISKGKMYYLSSLDSIDYDRAPFYSMYEEFSPVEQTDVSGFNDFYLRMEKGEYYDIVHDCNSVTYMQHYFSMSGKKGKTESQVSSLVFYIPDKRGFVDSIRNYRANHLPKVGMYIIELDAEAQPSSTEDFYTVTVTWESNLDNITDNTIPQHYDLYEIVVKPDGTRDTTLLVPNTPNVSYTYDVPQDSLGYQIYYYVIGTPDDATNKDEFFARSKDDHVNIPGLDDFIGLALNGYESDYVVTEEKNYYRNYLAPQNLDELGAFGITPSSIGDGIRTIVLYRNNDRIAYLDLIMQGDKAYYRIRYERDENNNNNSNN